ncbi:MAG: hypothetical protein EOP85_06040 [Verrucomicrobiaceae bacterium]|nr:MAG: hypothetical protein EOP85_06040 [Verrucomicrobiaceae bacterium]
MTHLEALREISTFWPGASPFESWDTSEEIRRLEAEFGRKLSAGVRLYLENGCPRESVLLETVGNPIEIYPASRLGARQPGYSHDSSDAPLPDWDAAWFLIADEGADPIAFDLNEPDSPVNRASHGMGEWSFGRFSDSAGQFLLCAAAVHHALTAWGPEPITDDENGFRLKDEPAKWLFPRMKKWAGQSYDEWCSIFDNH